ncbi:type II toxin-antitoxin system HipA family toxin [Treponema sp.]|uniref:type II toxin-antitoxin system HipA family toxin n=1 Tax=Treponema sp. TaxID=166 RepID=UPI00298E432A|nr:type II toxin-antitoxin system HipA family toxin [Treponema sp.]
MILNVFYGIRKCGILSSTENRGIVFKYDDEYLSDASAKPVSLSLPLKSEEYNQKECLPFFSGLIPEEYTRKRVADYLHVSELSIMKLLEAIGQECAGYITIAGEDFDSSVLKQEYKVTSSDYEKISQSDLENFVANIQQRPFIKADDKLRLSLAGAQEKLSLAFFDEEWYLPLNGAPSTHILKPTREGSLASLARNEYECMMLAKKCGLNVPDVQLINISGKDVLIVERYDRIIKRNAISRLHQEDMCQAAGIMTDKKYQADGGPGIVEIYQMIKKNSVLPVIDLQAFLKNVLFNYLVGNCDAHSKNYSFIYDTNGKARLSPLYDVVSTIAYPGLTRKLSMKIGSHYEIEKISLDDFSILAETVGVNIKVINSILEELRTTINETSLRNQR